MDEYIGATEAARRLGITRQYLYALINNGTVAGIREEPKGPFKTKITWKFRVSDIDALLKKDKRARAAKAVA